MYYVKKKNSIYQAKVKMSSFVNELAAAL